MECTQIFDDVVLDNQASHPETRLGVEESLGGLFKPHTLVSDLLLSYLTS